MTQPDEQGPRALMPFASIFKLQTRAERTRELLRHLDALDAFATSAVRPNHKARRFVAAARRKLLAQLEASGKGVP